MYTRDSIGCVLHIITGLENETKWTHHQPSSPCFSSGFGTPLSGIRLWNTPFLIFPATEFYLFFAARKKEKSGTLKIYMDDIISVMSTKNML